MSAHCTGCGKKGTWFDPLADGEFCRTCWSKENNRLIEEAKQKKSAEAEQAQEDAKLRADAASRMILTTETAHNLPVMERLGIVSAEVVIGMNLFRDIASAFSDTFGGRSKTMQTGLRQAREAALAELKLEAYELGADAVVGVDLDYSEISGGGKSMLFLVASGTAVSLEKEAVDAPPT